MRFEGIHHITCITADAPGNVDFYVRVLGLRLVKKTVNQDDPTVYHLFYADEKGSAGRRPDLLRVPAALAAAARAPGWCTGSSGASPPTRRSTSGRSGSQRENVPTQRADRRPALRRSRGPRPRARRRPDGRRAADRRPPGDPARARAAGLRRRARLRATPSRAAACSRRRSRSSRGATSSWEVARRRARRLVRLRQPARRSRHPGRRHRPPRRLGLAAGGARSVARARRRRRRAADAGDRPLLLQVDLLPRAERRALRDRHDRPRLHRRRAARDTSASGSRCRPTSSTCASRSSRC